MYLFFNIVLSCKNTLPLIFYSLSYVISMTNALVYILQLINIYVKRTRKNEFYVVNFIFGYSTYLQQFGLQRAASRES